MCAAPEHMLFYAFYWDEPEHLKLRFEKKNVFLTRCITLLGVIIWKSQRIQTPKTRTLVHILPEYKFTLPVIKLFSCPKSKEFTLAWTRVRVLGVCMR